MNYTWSDRAHDADFEYVLFNYLGRSFGWEILKILVDTKKSKNLLFMKKFKSLPIFRHCGFFKPIYLDSASNFEYN